MFNKILIITDNQKVYKYLKEKRLKLQEMALFSFSCTNMIHDEHIFPVDVKKESDIIIRNYDMVISWHCKQIFPPILIDNILCINIHPGLNPYNRGWYPQVFSIINKKPCGATIHIMDNEIDHGPIIAQRKIEIEDYDTSETAYNRILQAEFELFEEHIVSLINGNYSIYKPCNEGNVNTKKDFANLCKLDLSEVMTLGDSIDLLRALSFEKYNNAYFIDSKGRKVFISLKLYVD